MMIKVAIISDDPGRGGAYKIASEIMEGLDKSWFQVHHYFLCNSEESFGTGTFIGKPLVNIDYSLKDYLRLAFFPNSFERSFAPLNDALFKYQPDLIHFHTHPCLLALINGLEKAVPRAKIIFTDHLQRIRYGELSPLKQYLMSRVYRELFRKVRVVFVSKYAFDTALKLRYANKQKDFVLVNSINTNIFKPSYQDQTQELRVIFLSRIHPIKGHNLLLDAWKQLPKINHLSLQLYGIEDDGGSIKNRLSKETFKNPVVYNGMTHAPAPILQQSQVGVFPSYREGLPLALLEMMASGLPVIASDISEIKDIITDKKDGILFKNGDAKDLAGKLQLLLDDRSLRTILGKEARRSIQKKFGESISDKYKHLYRQLHNE